MAKAVGSRLLEKLDAMVRESELCIRLKHSGTVHAYDMSSRGCTARVLVDPGKWLSLECDFAGGPSSETVHYCVDTDLYDIGSPKFRVFAQEIESEILAVARAIEVGDVYVRSTNSGSEVVVSVYGGYIRLKKGRWLTSCERYVRLELALVGSGWRHLAMET